MKTIIEVVKELPKMACVGRISTEAIAAAEEQLQTCFADEYRMYLAEFGAVSARRIELTGIISVDYCNVVSATKAAWELNPQVHHQLYVIENTYVDGVVIWQDSTGAIYQTTPKTKPARIASSLVEYIASRTKR